MMCHWQPVETEAVETEAVEIEPVETEPVETETTETEPVETETKSDLLNKISLLIAQHVNISQNRKLISRERSL